MKDIQTSALLTALMLSVSSLVSCGAQQLDTVAENPPSGGNTGTDNSSDIIGDEGIIEGSFGTIAGQELPKAKIPEKPDGATPLKDDNGFRELQHKIHDANWKDSIFRNHTSLTLTLDDKYKHIYDMCDYIYLAPDYSYGHASYYEQYSKDREILQYVGTDSYSPYPVYVADLSENYTGHVYWYVPQEEDDFFDFEHEAFTDIYEKDGKTYLLVIHKMQYDLPEPEEVSTFLKIFENGDNNTSTVTYVANPCKANEISKSMTVPQYSAVSFYSQDMPKADVFLDKECTKSANQGWDGISDTTFYVIPHNG